MTDTNEQGRAEPPLAGDETATLLGSLDRQRATLAWECGGLDAAGMQAKVGAPSIHPGRVAQAPGLSRTSTEKWWVQAYVCIDEMVQHPPAIGGTPPVGSGPTD